MLVRIVLVLCLLGPFATRPARVAAQAVPAAAAFRVPELLRGTYNSPDRAIRRDVPLRNAIRRDLESGARDFSGRPGPNYWQLEADYTIEVRLDPETQTITGSETIEMHNNSTIEMTEIVLRLDHNILRGTVPRGSSVPAENTEGIVVTRLTVNGQRVDLNPPPRALGEAPRGLAAYGMDQTVARIAPPTPITGKSTSHDPDGLAHEAVSIPTADPAGPVPAQEWSIRWSSIRTKERRITRPRISGGP